MGEGRRFGEVDVSSSPEQRVRDIRALLVDDPDYNGWDSMGLRLVKLVSATEGAVVHELTVTPALCNKSGNLHGGAAATILDNLTSTALYTIARAGFLDGGHVSRTLTCTYLRPVPAGTTVRIECEAVAGGRSTANCIGRIKTLDGKVCVTCVHDKAVFTKSKL